MALHYLTYTILCLAGLCVSWVWQIYTSYARLHHVSGPFWHALTRFRLAWDAWHARAIHSVRTLHTKYGPVVRIGPDQVSFNSLAALRTIYGAGSVFERTSFYSMFDVYGRPNLFTFHSSIEHRNRRKLLSHIYSNQYLMEDRSVNMVKSKVQGFLNMLESEPDHASEIFTSLHYFSFDAISEFVYGPEMGGTNALNGNKVDRRLIDDILDPQRRRLSWFLVHFPSYTKWITTRTGISEKIINLLGLLPMQKPFTYTGIRGHALQAFYQHKAAVEKQDNCSDAPTSVVSRLLQISELHNLSDMDIASECADHLLAGIDTTADSLMFMIWALSLPQNKPYQDKLRRELFTIQLSDDGWPNPKDLARLPWLNSVMKESLRLYAPLPAFEPRSSPTDTIIDGIPIPKGTTVGMSPYCMHREESVYPEPLKFKPDRWLNEDGTLLPEYAVQNKWFWAFSSGPRMCIGIHLANAEMLMLIATLFRRYSTSARHPDTTPGITSRFEIFLDETSEKMREHECWIEFHKLEG